MPALLRLQLRRRRDVAGAPGWVQARQHAGDDGQCDCHHDEGAVELYQLRKIGAEQAMQALQTQPGKEQPQQSAEHADGAGRDLDPAGDVVQTTGGWQDFVVISPDQAVMGLNKIPTGIDPAMMLSVLGVTGLTAYFGLLDLGEPKAGETVLVSGAAGATGSVAGQIAKIKGCRVVGIAGGPEKCKWLTESAGFDAAIDYKEGNVDQAIAQACAAELSRYHVPRIVRFVETIATSAADKVERN